MKCLISICLISAVGLLPLYAKEPMMKEVKAGKGNQILPYRWIEVGEGTKPSLVLFLHGMGERGTDNQRHIKHCIPKLLAWLEKEKKHSLVLAPQCAEDAVWSNSDGGFKNHDAFTIKNEPSYPMKLVFEVVDDMVKKHNVDKSRIYITGLSMGGYGAFDALARRPHFFAAVMPICGGGDQKTVAKIKHVPIWVFHGDADRTVPPQMSRTMVKALKSAGGAPKYTEYPKVGHNAWSATYANPAVWQWLFKQKK